MSNLCVGLVRLSEVKLVLLTTLLAYQVYTNKFLTCHQDMIHFSNISNVLHRFTTFLTFPVTNFLAYYISSYSERFYRNLALILSTKVQEPFKGMVSFPGDVILREEPYAAVLEAIFRVNHCGHCLKKTPTPIPCFECSTVSNY